MLMQALVNADREIEILGRAPQRVIDGVLQLSVIVGIGPDKAAAEAGLAARKPHLGDRVINRLHWQHRDAEQPVGIGFAVIGEPPVLGAA
jgi:hypothetical protein